MQHAKLDNDSRVHVFDGCVYGLKCIYARMKEFLGFHMNVESL